MEKNAQWQLWIDTGGTFTDCIAISPDGKKQRIKVLSQGGLRGKLEQRIAERTFRFSHKWAGFKPVLIGYHLSLLTQQGNTFRVTSIDLDSGIMEVDQDFKIDQALDFEIGAGEEAPILAARLVTGTPLDRDLPPIHMKLGFTKGTNALLERKGARTTLLITKGFKDLLAIGSQQRPHLFQLDIPNPELLYEQVLEVDERIDANGQVLRPLKKVKALIAQIECDSIAVALLNSYKNSEHEQQLKKALQESDKSFVSLSQEISPGIKILPRAQASLVNAYLAPLVSKYLDNIKACLKNGHLQVMTSIGGLAEGNHFQPKDSLLSGPAGGVVGASIAAVAQNKKQVITLDMGGTSTDVARFNEQYDYRYITKIGGLEMSIPSIAIETVAAGGGSICFYKDGRLQVGPESAGAFPGPACYGAGGPLTVTDINLLLGKLDPGAMSIPIDLEAAKSALFGIINQIKVETDEDYHPLELLKGYQRIANHKMAAAIRKISIAKGFDPKDYALLAFGGAGGMHACQIAEMLEMEEVILPIDGGLLSAYGIGMSSVERFAMVQVNQPLASFIDQIDTALAQLVDKASLELRGLGIEKEAIQIKSQTLFLRFLGQETPLEIEYVSKEEVVPDFKNKYSNLFGYFPSNRPLEIERIKVIVTSNKETPKQVSHSKIIRAAWPIKKRTAIFDNQQLIEVYYWPNLPEQARIEGPAILLNDHSTAFIEQGWELQVTANQDCALQKINTEKTAHSELREAIALELFINRFTAIAEEMGAQLQRTAFSVNIKERLDFSCALLDKEGNLLVNAPHIPVHLGSLGVCARLILEVMDVKEGDIIITNHPKYGGSHLPDITLLKGVFYEGQIVGYVINRAHHAELGGTRPGSMPPDATSLEEEGVVIPPTYLAKNDEVDWLTIESILKNATYPTRAMAENIADIKAALASLRAGERALHQMVEDHSLQKVQFYMSQIKQLATHKLLTKMQSIKEKMFKAEELLDDGANIQVKIVRQKEHLLFDFTGTAPVHKHNLNANPAIVHSAILYILRLWCDEEIPLNDGLMVPVRIKLPESLLNPQFVDDPKKCPAVVGGNTEVSQRLVDTLIKALGLAACSQGTMNNLLFGNNEFGYYETISGGVGAGEGFHGRTAVHQHMTNTKITDPEDLEWRYPVRLLNFTIRKNSGGAGMWHGGNGVVREIEFLVPLSLTVLAQHRKIEPYGMHGGSPGKVGEQYLIRTDGWREYISAAESREVQKGDRIVIKTPGGGGWG